MSKVLPKLLIVFNPEETLIKLNKVSVNTITQSVSQQRFDLKPDHNELLRFLFIRNRLFFKVAVWSSTTVEATDHIAKIAFSTFAGSLLFKYASPAENDPKDLQRIWYNYPEFTSKNTIYIDTSASSATPKDNIITFPRFSADNSLKILQDYIKFFSYQFQDNRCTDFLHFIKKVRFPEYLAEHSKQDMVVPKGEAYRFW